MTDESPDTTVAWRRWRCSLQTPPTLYICHRTFRLSALVASLDSVTAYSPPRLRLGESVHCVERQTHAERRRYSPPGLATRLICFADVSDFIFICYIFTISVRPIISKSTGAIFAKFAHWLQMINLKLVHQSPKGRCHGNHFCWLYPHN